MDFAIKAKCYKKRNMKKKINYFSTDLLQFNLCHVKYRYITSIWKDRRTDSQGQSGCATTKMKAI